MEGSSQMIDYDETPIIVLLVVIAAFIGVALYGGYQREKMEEHCEWLCGMNRVVFCEEGRNASSTPHPWCDMGGGKAERR